MWNRFEALKDKVKREKNPTVLAGETFWLLPRVNIGKRRKPRFSFPLKYTWKSLASGERTSHILQKQRNKS